MTTKTTKTRNTRTMTRTLRTRIEKMLHEVKDWLDKGQPALARQTMDEAAKLIGKRSVIIADSVRDFERQLKAG